MNISKTTFDNYAEHKELLLMSKALRPYANESVGLEKFIAELESSIWEYGGRMTLLFIEARYQDHLNMMAELEKEFQS